ncbi:hypothetical protein M408DRAFT_71532 [Serendipita vermifera MAFF 305830]|uniref:Transmembrane protein n=1 Tax=Serendipita vermifera MAFF 305830 TaxID=933852 RepID=A0A0C3B6Z3_SERVB|nr:hypothetical protein M408DRAFT_71532 [Serendipita vermifera MAFF 305830]
MDTTSSPYLPSITTAACACNVVAYSLASACSWCQDTMGQPTHWATQADWEKSCTTMGQLYLLDGLPRNSRPPSILIPHWAYSPPSSGIWDPAQAQSVANISAVTPSTTLSTIQPTSTTMPSPIASTHGPGTISVDNNLPGLVIIALVFVICFIIAIVIVARKTRRLWSRRKPDPENCNDSRENFALKTGLVIFPV